MGQEYVPSIATSPNFQKNPVTLILWENSQFLDARN